jgi:hypothetical protein
MKKPFSIWLAVTVLCLGICAPIFIYNTVDLININAQHNRLRIIHDQWLLSNDATIYRQTDIVKYQKEQQSSNNKNDIFSQLGLPPPGGQQTTDQKINNDVDNEAWLKAGATISNYADWYNSKVDSDQALIGVLGVSFYAYILLSAVYWIIVWGFTRKREKPTDA